MQSIASIVQSVQIDLQKLNDDNNKDLLHSLSTNKKSIQNLDQQKFDLLDKKNKSFGKKPILRFQKQIYTVEGFISSAKKFLQQNLTTIRNNTNDNIDTKKRVNRILQELDSSATDSITDSSDKSEMTAIPSSSSASAQGLQAATQGKHLLRTMQRQAKTSSYDQKKGMFENCANLIQKQLTALKKHKLFSNLFMAFNLISQLVVSLLASPAAAALIQKITPLVQFLESKFLEKFANRMKDAQTVEKNIQQNSMVAIQSLASNQNATERALESTFRKTQQKLETL